MFHKAIDLKFLSGTKLLVTFDDKSIKQYDVANLFDKYPQLRALKDRELFLSGQLTRYSIIWNDDLDIETETIYEDGKTMKTYGKYTNFDVAFSVQSARAQTGLTQKEVSELTGIDQSDLSKIERGIANPSVSTLERIAKALNMKLVIKMEPLTSGGKG